MNKPNLDTIADRLLNIVKENDPEEKHPKSKIAKICNISQSAVYQWFQGPTKDPKAVHIGAICRYYGADSMWAIIGDEAGDRTKADQNTDSKAASDDNDEGAPRYKTTSPNKSLENALLGVVNLGNVH